MDKSSRELPDSNDRRKFPKNNFFSYHSRVIDNFSKSIDRHLFNIQKKITGNNPPLSERILQSYQESLSGGDSSTKNNELIGDLAQDAMQFIDQRKSESRITAKSEVLISKATSSLIERTFKTLLALSTELNKALGFSDLSIRATEPAVTQRAGKSESSHATCIQASIFTGLFRLLMEGKDGAISFYMIPTANLSAMMEASSIYPAFTIWSANFEPPDQVYWITPDGILTEQMLDRACAELIRLLVETTQEEMSPGYSHNLANPEKAASVGISDFNQADPWLQQAPAHAISSDGTRTDSVPSLGSMYKDSGIFDTVDYDYASPSVQNFFEHKTDLEKMSETKTEPVVEQKATPKSETVGEEKPAYQFKPMFQLKSTAEHNIFLKASKPEEPPSPSGERAPLVQPVSQPPVPPVPPMVAPPASPVPPPASLVPPPASSVPPPASLVPPPASLVPTQASLVPPPASLVPPPASLVPLPASLVPPPASLVPPPASLVPPPASQVPPPASQVPPPASHVPPPASQVPPPASLVPPPASQVPPPASLVPPPASLVPPPVSQVPPPASQVPPVSQQGAPSAPLVSRLVSHPAPSAPLPILDPSLQTVVDVPSVQDAVFKIDEVEGAIVGSSSKSKSELEKNKSFDLKAEYYAQTTKPVQAASTKNKRFSRNKSNTRKNRKNKRK